MMTITPCTTNFIAFMFNQTINYKNSLTICQMGQLEGHQTEKPNHTCPCYIHVSYSMLKLVNVAKHNPTSTGKTYNLLFFKKIWFYFHLDSLLFLFMLYNNFLPISFLL